MASKKSPATAEEEDIRKSLNVLTEDVMDCKIRQQQLLELLLEERNRLLALNERKNKKLAELEKRADEQEQLARLNELIITGLNVRPRPDAPGEMEGSSPPGEGEACRPLPSRRRLSDKQANIRRAANRKHKLALVKAHGEKLKGTDV